MRLLNANVSMIAISALSLIASPALAEGKAGRARAAIAEASGKIDAADKVGVGGDPPRRSSCTRGSETSRYRKDDHNGDDAAQLTSCPNGIVAS